jgi:hypothetical protein
MVHGEQSQLQAIGDADFFENAGEVMLHGLFADAEFLGDFLVGAAVCNHRNNFDLTGGQVIPVAVLPFALPRRGIAQALAGKGDLSMLDIDAALFATAPNISLDYAVMEKAAAAGNVAVVRGTFDWSDIGSWQAMAELSAADADGNRGQIGRAHV